MIIKFKDIYNKEYFIQSCNIIYLQPIQKNISEPEINFLSGKSLIFKVSGDTNFIIRLTNNETIQVSKIVGLSIINELIKQAEK